MRLIRGKLDAFTAKLQPGCAKNRGKQRVFAHRRAAKRLKERAFRWKDVDAAGERLSTDFCSLPRAGTICKIFLHNGLRAFS
jgi:hypothetical protein